MRKARSQYTEYGLFIFRKRISFAYFLPCLSLKFSVIIYLFIQTFQKGQTDLNNIWNAAAIKKEIEN